MIPVIISLTFASMLDVTAGGTAWRLLIFCLSGPHTREIMAEIICCTASGSRDGNYRR